MTDPGPRPSYLEEAAIELRKARTANDNRAATLTSWLSEGAVPVLVEVNDRRMEMAEGFTRLAAIERGLPPCCHAARPEPAQEQPS